MNATCSVCGWKGEHERSATVPVAVDELAVSVAFLRVTMEVSQGMLCPMCIRAIGDLLKSRSKGVEPKSVEEFDRAIYRLIEAAGDVRQWNITWPTRVADAQARRDRAAQEIRAERDRLYAAAYPPRHDHEDAE